MPPKIDNVCNFEFLCLSDSNVRGYQICNITKQVHLQYKTGCLFIDVQQTYVHGYIKCKLSANDQNTDMLN